MTLTDPREALAENSSFIGYLVGLAGVTRLVRALADGPGADQTPVTSDDFVDALLGLASLGSAIEHLGASAAPPTDTRPRVTTQTRWLR